MSPLIQCYNFDVNAYYGDFTRLNSFQYTYGMTEVHIQSNDKRSPEMSLMGETIESITKDDVVIYWGKSPFYKRLLNSVKMFLVRYLKCVCFPFWKMVRFRFHIISESKIRK